MWRSTPWLQPLSHSLEPTDVLEERQKPSQEFTIMRILRLQPLSHSLEPTDVLEERHKPSQEFTIMRILRHSLWLYNVDILMYWKCGTAVRELGRVSELDCSKRILSHQSPALLPELRATPPCLPFICLQTVPVDRNMTRNGVIIILKHEWNSWFTYPWRKLSSINVFNMQQIKHFIMISEGSCDVE